MYFKIDLPYSFDSGEERTDSPGFDSLRSYINKAGGGR